MKRILLVLGAALLFPAVAVSGVTYHEGTSEITVLLGKATFDGLKSFDPLQDYKEAGLTLDVDDFAWEEFRPPGFPDSWGPFYYPNGGVNEMIEITRTDAGDFNVLEMNVSNGWGSSITYVWIQAYLDSGLVGQFDADVASGKLIGLTGTYDEVRIAAYYDAATRDLHDPSGYQAIALDNAAFGTTFLKCDTNCDGVVNAFDIDPFVLALTDPDGYEAQYPNCDIWTADVNGDGKVDAFDIDPFVACLTK